jgi:hypothetical protein
MWLYVPSLSAPESEASTSDWPAGVAPFATSSGKPFQRPSSWPGWKKRSWIRLLSGTISQPLMADRGVAEWISSLEATPASRSALLALVEEMRTSDTFGLTSDASSPRSSRRSASLRTCQATLVLDSRRLFPTWKAWATAWRRYCSGLRMSARRTGASGCGSWPTPTANDATGSTHCYSSGDHEDIALKLPGAARLWATRTARNWKDGTDPSSAAPTNGLLGRQAPRMMPRGLASPKRLNPRFVEWLMGFPRGWTDLDRSATPSSQPAPQKPSNYSQGVL